jgi:polyphosphate kinase
MSNIILASVSIGLIIAGIMSLAPKYDDMNRYMKVISVVLIFIGAIIFFIWLKY